MPTADKNPMTMTIISQHTPHNNSTLSFYFLCQIRVLEVVTYEVHAPDTFEQHYEEARTAIKKAPSRQIEEVSLRIFENFLLPFEQLKI